MKTSCSTFENVTGTDFDDSVVGNNSDNLILGGDGDDTLSGGAGNDTLDGGTGKNIADYSDAEAGIDIDLANNIVNNDGYGDTDEISNFAVILGSDYDDTILGDDGDNTLYGAEGSDSLNGGAGDDVLISAAGTDTLTGGEGADTFVIANGSVTITDFNADEGDSIVTYTEETGYYIFETDTDDGFYFSNGVNNKYLAFENLTYSEFQDSYYWVPPTTGDTFDLDAFV